MNKIIGVVIFLGIICFSFYSASKESKIESVNVSYTPQKNIIGHQCEEAFLKDFPETKNLSCKEENEIYWIGGRMDCSCESFEFIDGWDKKYTRYDGVKINEKDHYFNLK